ncbi:putative zinc finger, CCHC-type containing protein [Tanacetum coccineum]
MSPPTIRGLEKEVEELSFRGFRKELWFRGGGGGGGSFVLVCSCEWRCLPDASICYRCLDVQRISRELPPKTPAKNSHHELPPRTPAKNSRQILFFTIKADVILTNTKISHTLLPSQPQTDHTITMKMVPYEAFACRYEARDVVLRESYKPKTRCKLYYACPLSKLLYENLGPSRNAECSNCKHLLGKITVLEATVELYMHPKEHTLNSAALLHEVYNDIRKLGLEYFVIWNIMKPTCGICSSQVFFSVAALTGCISVIFNMTLTDLLWNPSSRLRDQRRKGRGIPTIKSKLIKRKRRSGLCRAFGVLGLTTERRDGLKEKETKIAVAREGKEASPRTTQRKGLRCPVLNNTNYTLWALRIKKILVANGVWDLVEGTSTSKEIDVKKDSSASAYLFQGLPEDLQMQVAGCETAKEIWDSLKSRFIGTEDVQQAHSQQLKSEFERLVMKEDESIDSFAGKLMSIITKAATCGLTFDEQTKVRKVLNAVPDKFLPVVATIEMIVDFKTVKLEEIIGKLKTYEERIKFRKASQEDNSEKLLLTRQRNNRNYKHNYGNGRRGGGNQTRGRWKDRDEGHTSDESEGTDNKPRRNGDKSQIDCYKCGKLGHYAYECANKKKEEVAALLVETDDEPALLIWCQLLENLPLPNIKWICPTSPTQPFTLFGGLSTTTWFDVNDMSEDASQDVEGLDASAIHVLSFLSNEPPNIKLGVGGFSMGAATAIYSAHCYARGKFGNGTGFSAHLDAVVGLSGWLPCARELNNEVEGYGIDGRAASLPILLCHGRSDDVVHFRHGVKSAEKLTSAGFENLTFKSFPSLGHNVIPEEMDAVSSWLTSKLELDGGFR